MNAPACGRLTPRLQPAHPIPAKGSDTCSHDVDHIEPYDTGGATSTDNLACLCRRHHRAKTTGRWRYLRTPDGDFQWHGPYGTTYLVTDQRTRRLP